MREVRKRERRRNRESACACHAAYVRTLGGVLALYLVLNRVSLVIYECIGRAGWLEIFLPPSPIFEQVC